MVPMVYLYYADVNVRKMLKCLLFCKDNAIFPKESSQRLTVLKKPCLLPSPIKAYGML